MKRRKLGLKTAAAATKATTEEDSNKNATPAAEGSNPPAQE
jgi:hypothetical protein